MSASLPENAGKHTAMKTQQKRLHFEKSKREDTLYYRYGTKPFSANSLTSEYEETAFWTLPTKV
jgi:hypothetical protein